MPLAANPGARATRPAGSLAWFALTVHAVNRQTQTFSGQIRTFDAERHLLSRNAFAKTVSEGGRLIPIHDPDQCEIGQLTVMKRDSGVLSVQAKLYSGLSKEFLKGLTAAGRIALRIEILQRSGDQVTEVKLLGAMLGGNLTEKSTC